MLQICFLSFGRQFCFQLSKYARFRPTKTLLSWFVSRRDKPWNRCACRSVALTLSWYLNLTAHELNSLPLASVSVILSDWLVRNNLAWNRLWIQRNPIHDIHKGTLVVLNHHSMFVHVDFTFTKLILKPICGNLWDTQRAYVSQVLNWTVALCCLSQYQMAFASVTFVEISVCSMWISSYTLILAVCLCEQSNKRQKIGNIQGVKQRCNWNCSEHINLIETLQFESWKLDRHIGGRMFMSL